MNKLVIHTQYLENYGDSKDPYMKFKGGTTYVMSNCGELNENEIATLVATASDANAVVPAAAAKRKAPLNAPAKTATKHEPPPPPDDDGDVLGG